MEENNTPDLAYEKSLIDRFQQYQQDFYSRKDNQLRASNEVVQKRVEKITLDLSTAATEPYAIKLPFKGVVVHKVFQTSSPTTDVTGQVKIMFDYPNIMNVANAIPLGANDSFIMDQEVSKGFLVWDAQADTSITISFLIDIDFRMGSQKTSIVGTVTSTIVGSVAVTNAGTFKVQSYPSSTQQITKSGAGSSSTVTIGSGKYARVSGTLSAGANASASSAGVKINGNFAGYITNASVGGFIGNVACGFGPFDLAEGDTVQLVNTLGTNGTADSACNIAIFDK